LQLINSVLFSILLVAQSLLGQTVTVFAGDDPGLARSGGPATETGLGRVAAVAIDSRGDIYFGDASQAMVMKVSSDGILTIVAGNGKSSPISAPIGDGASATDAPLNAGWPLAVDSSGNLFIVDYNRIRKVTPDGLITTVLEGRDLPSAGGRDTLGPYFAGLAIDAKDRVYFSERSASRVWRLDPDGTFTRIAGNGVYGPPSGDGGLATEAVLGEPHGIALDSAGNLLMADGRYGRIRKVSAVDGMIDTVAGGGSVAIDRWPVAATDASLPGIDSLAFDHFGNLYFMYLGAKLARISPDGILSSIQMDPGYGFSGDGGPASEAQFTGSASYIAQFALDDEGSILYPDGGNGRLRKIDSAGVVTTIAGNGKYQFAGDGGPAKKAILNAPNYISFDSAGNLYVSDSGNHRVRRISSGGIIDTVAGNGLTRLLNRNPEGDTPALQTPLATNLLAVTGSADGNFYYAEFGFIRRVDKKGNVSTVAGSGNYFYGVGADDDQATHLLLAYVEGLAIGPDGLLYFTDEGGNVIRRLNLDGTLTTIVGRPTSIGGFSGDGGPARDAVLRVPRGLAFGYAPSESSNIYFADVLNERVRKVGADGWIETIAGNGSGGSSGDGGLATEATLFLPQAVVVDRDGYVYIAEWGNGRIRRVSPNGVITTLVSSLAYPSGLALDAVGTLYIADTGHNRILTLTDPQQ
jgi:sugar lactone lactonase YvrE